MMICRKVYFLEGNGGKKKKKRKRKRNLSIGLDTTHRTASRNGLCPPKVV